MSPSDKPTTARAHDDDHEDERDDVARELATDAEWERHERFLSHLKERGRRSATLDAFDKDWWALARWYVDTTGQSIDTGTFTAMDASHYLAFLEGWPHALGAQGRARGGRGVGRGRGSEGARRRSGRHEHDHGVAERGRRQSRAAEVQSGTE